ncbi:MAG: serine/threonine-protein kinase [Gemmatimonadota bacterium]
MKICPVCSTEYADDVKFCPNDGQTLRAAAPANDLVGQVVADRYHVVKKLGEGGMGQVYLAEHVKMGRRSAIKVMNPAMVHDPDAVARFNREASNASRIAHPNVCAIYDFGETPDGLIYLAMEFIEGEPLTDLLEREGALPLARAAEIFRQAADALQAAHDLGIVHRDLKPDNIMLTRRKGGGDTVKVVDFGIAKAVAGDESGQKVTKTGLVIGTPEFMSPEQLSGDTLDGRSDLYSLALVLYRMLTGKLPFEATTVQETMIKRLTDEPTTLADARPDLTFPPGMQPVLDTALARTPAERYQSVAKFAADIGAITGGWRPGTGSVPQTRGDTEAKTQLLDPSSATPTTRISAQVRAPAAAKKRSLVPIAVGLVVVLAGGGAWVVLSGGTKADGTPPDSLPAVSHDTAQFAGRSDTTTRGNRQGGQTTAPTAPAIAPPSAARGPDSAAIDRQLDDVMELVLDPQTAGSGRIQATTIYDRTDAPATLRAQAAFMVAQAFFVESRLDQACQWNGRALQLKPLNATYLKFQRDQGCQS